jgi:hypothetical protein
MPFNLDVHTIDGSRPRPREQEVIVHAEARRLPAGEINQAQGS